MTAKNVERKLYMEKVMGKVSSGIKTGKQDTKMKIFFIALSGVRDRTMATRDFCVRLKDKERIFARIIGSGNLNFT